MTRKFYNPAALALAALAAGAPLLLGACKATDTAGNMSAATAASASAHPDGIRRMGPAELQALVEGGNVVIYDTRSKMSYEQEHIRGSLSMPHEEVAARAAEFPRDKTLVFYCT